MIWDSQPWKAEIARIGSRLRRRATQKQWREATFAKVEQEAFYLAYAIRKLIEARKLSDELESYGVKAVEYAPAGKAVDVMNWHKIDELYDLTSSQQKALSVREFCNQIIHSFVFMVATADSSSGINGLFVSSDRKRHSGLYYVSLDEVLTLADAVVNDEVVHLVMQRSAIGEPREVITKSSKLPSDHVS